MTLETAKKISRGSRVIGILVFIAAMIGRWLIDPNLAWVTVAFLLAMFFTIISVGLKYWISKKD
jgi:hypothetical protein